MGHFGENGIVLKNYHIEKSIGQGAFGEVYLATHIGLNGKRAIKVLLRDDIGVGSSDYDEYRNRFRQESQLMELFKDPHLVMVYDFQEEDNTLFLIMEYASGCSLKQRLDSLKKDGRLFSVEETVKIGIDIARGLAALHQKDVVHRDLKPSNILFDADGNAKVADLGLAQIPGGASMRSQLSVPKPHPGTPAYMSPEQETAGSYLRPASDIYSLGLILFEMLTGRSYKSQRPGTRLKSLAPESPEWLDDLLVRMLSENPKDRPWDGTEVNEKLQCGIKTENPTIQDDQLMAAGMVSGSELTSPEVHKLNQSKTHAANTYKKPIRLSEKITIWTILILLLILGIVCVALVYFNRSGSTGSVKSEIPSTAENVKPANPKALNISNAKDVVELRSIPGYSANSMRTCAHQFSPDGMTLASLSDGDTIRLWDLPSGLEFQRLKNTAAFSTFTFSPDGKKIITGSLDNSVGLWEVESGKLLKYTKINTLPYNVFYRPDGQTLAAGMDGLDLVFSDFNGNNLFSIQSPKTSYVALSPDGRTLAITREPGPLLLFDIDTKKEIRTMNVTDAWMVEFSPDGTLLATKSGQKIGIWDVNTGKELRSIVGNAGLFLEMAFSPDGQLIASADDENNVRLWNAATGEALWESKKHSQIVRCIAFSPDGRYLASGSWDNTIINWGISD